MHSGDAWSGQKKIVATAICKDNINYVQMFESSRTKDVRGMGEGNDKDQLLLISYPCEAQHQVGIMFSS